MIVSFMEPATTTVAEVIVLISRLESLMFFSKGYFVLERVW